MPAAAASSIPIPVLLTTLLHAVLCCAALCRAVPCAGFEAATGFEAAVAPVPADAGFGAPVAADTF